MTSEILLQNEIILHRPDDSTTRVFPFTVPRTGGSLCLKLGFSPEFETDAEKNKKLILDAYKKDNPWLGEDMWPKDAPVSNLFTLSLDDPAGYRGNSHRKNTTGTYYVGDHNTSPGFYPGPISAGEWHVSLHMYAVVTEECRVKLEISFIEE